MPTFVMLTRLGHDSLKNPRSMETLGDQVGEHIKRECPGVHWERSLAVLGATDYVDIFSAPDNVAAAKVATIVRSFGHATTEVWPAMDWRDFKKLLHELPPSIIQT